MARYLKAGAVSRKVLHPHLGAESENRNVEHSTNARVVVSERVNDFTSGGADSNERRLPGLFRNEG